MNSALVSICIPTYNGAEFVAEAMVSAINQTYSYLEIVVSDDQSKDETIEIINSFKDKTKIPIKIFHHEPNGIGANWNNCIRNANGKYIKFLFQDDVLMPECVAEMVKVLELDKSFNIVTCKRKFIIEDSFKTEGYRQWIDLYKNCQVGLKLTTKKGYKCLDKSIFGQSTFFDSPKNKVGEPTNILFKKSIIEKIGFYREDLRQILDYEFCYRVLKFSMIPIIDKELVNFRLHGRQTTVKNKGTEQGDYVIYDKILFKNYFWLLSTSQKLYFFKKYYPIMGRNIEIIYKALRR